MLHVLIDYLVLALELLGLGVWKKYFCNPRKLKILLLVLFMCGQL